MAVYVDNMRASYNRMTMCHMMADCSAELIQMADKIGVQRKWIQAQGTHREHFDICLSKRKCAVAAGAKEVSGKQIVQMMRSKLENWAAEPAQPEMERSK